MSARLSPGTRVSLVTVSTYDSGRRLVRSRRDLEAL